MVDQNWGRGYAVIENFDPNNLYSIEELRNFLRDLQETVNQLIDKPTRPSNVFRVGSGVPSNNLGVDDDSYLDKDSGMFYWKDAGVYTSEYTDQLGAGGTGVTTSQATGIANARVAALVRPAAIVGDDTRWEQVKLPNEESWNSEDFD